MGVFLQKDPGHDVTSPKNHSLRSCVAAGPLWDANLRGSGHDVTSPKNHSLRSRVARSYFFFRLRFLGAVARVMLESRVTNPAATIFKADPSSSRRSVGRPPRRMDERTDFPPSMRPITVT